MPQRFAVLHPYRGMAENETAQRILLAAANLGLEAKEFTESDSILDYRPDFVLSLSHQDAKLTPFPTYGVLTAPHRYYQTPRFLRNVLSYDAYLTVSDAVRGWLEDLTFGTRKQAAPIGFYANTVPATTFAASWTAVPRLAYFGTNWDGNRHGALFERLSRRPYARFFGPAESWKSIDPTAYGGSVPFDGMSVLDTYRAAGAGLCLDLPDFAADGLPTNRIFEIAAAGVPAICGDNPFVRRWFGDDVLYVDQTAPPDVLLWQIDRHMAWIAAHPGDAQAMARAAHERFTAHLSLERLLPNILALHEDVLAGKGYTATSGEAPLPSLACIVRTGDRSEAMLRRALDSLRAQRYPGLRVVLVAWARAPWLDGVLAAYEDLAVSIVELPGGSRSASLWAGLRAVRDLGVEFFGLLDDDDELFPNHYRSLVSSLASHARAFPEAPPRLCYSACVEAALSPFANDTIVDASSLMRTQRRRIQQFHFHPPSQLNQRSFVCALMTFIASTALLSDEVLIDPGLEVAEDLYLWLLFAERTRFAFSCEVTACAHQHDLGQSDYADPERYGPAFQRIFYRVYGRSFPASMEYGVQSDLRQGAMDGRLFALVPPPGAAEGPSAAPATACEEAALLATTATVEGSGGIGAVAATGPIAIGVYDVEAHVDGGGSFMLELVHDGTVVDSGLLQEACRSECRFPSRRLIRRIEVPPFLAVKGAELRLFQNGGTTGGDAALVGLALRRRGGFPRCRLDQLPRDWPVWIYGAGEGGRTMLGRLMAAGGFRVAGFMDRAKRGTIAGHPVMPAEDALRQTGSEASIVIASQYWQEIDADLAALGARNVYCNHPVSSEDLAILR